MLKVNLIALSIIFVLLIGCCGLSETTKTTEQCYQEQDQCFRRAHDWNTGYTDTAALQKCVDKFDDCMQSATIGIDED